MESHCALFCQSTQSLDQNHILVLPLLTSSDTTNQETTRNASALDLEARKLTFRSTQSGHYSPSQQQERPFEMYISVCFNATVLILLTSLL